MKETNNSNTPPTPNNQRSSALTCGAFVKIPETLDNGFYLCGTWVKYGYKKGHEWRQAVAEWDGKSWLLYECGYLAMSGEMEWTPTHYAELPSAPPVNQKSQDPVSGI